MRPEMLAAVTLLSLLAAHCGEPQCPGLEACGGVCADTVIDHDNCGECGRVCDADEVCAGGRCVLDCENECDMLRIVRCADPPDEALQVCVRNADGCLEWGPPFHCDAGETCVDGECVGDGCDDGCETEAQRRCEDDGYVVCGDHDGDGCLEWGPTQPCDAAQICADGDCVGECTDARCTEGERGCHDDAVWRCAVDLDADPCLDWLPVEDCGDDGRCDDGECVDCGGNLDRCDDDHDCCNHCDCVVGYCGCI